jgi:glycyl-tRNA synthetase alpha subunit
MIQLHNDEKIAKVFEVKKSIHGKGAFYITNYGVCFESQKHGMVIKVGFERLKSYSAVRKDTFQIVWNTQNNDRFRYEMIVNSAEEIMTVYRNVNKEYSESMTEIQALKSKYGITY